MTKQKKANKHKRKSNSERTQFTLCIYTYAYNLLNYKHYLGILRMNELLRSFE